LPGKLKQAFNFTGKNQYNKKKEDGRWDTVDNTKGGVRHFDHSPARKNTGKSECECAQNGKG
jgi:hypothetical protein